MCPLRRTAHYDVVYTNEQSNLVFIIEYKSKGTGTVRVISHRKIYYVAIFITYSRHTFDAQKY